ncbi:hypothetical protein [Ruegeria sp. ANG-S4]|uniref:hypothetical protein n=1 Tax=Ruegeria sp. ANG-S4 TaxID=1577904 RepID=UPI00126A5A33|nr:hypothetical protein [Ruegeria sp. ANG-S4]
MSQTILITGACFSRETRSMPSIVTDLIRAKVTGGTTLLFDRAGSGADTLTDAHTSQFDATFIEALKPNLGL